LALVMKSQKAVIGQYPLSLQRRQNIQLKKPLLKIHALGFFEKKCIALPVLVKFF